MDDKLVGDLIKPLFWKQLVGGSVASPTWRKFHVITHLLTILDARTCRIKTSRSLCYVTELATVGPQVGPTLGATSHDSNVGIAYSVAQWNAPHMDECHCVYMWIRYTGHNNKPQY